MTRRFQDIINAGNELSQEELTQRLQRAFQISDQAVAEGVTPGAALAVGNREAVVYYCSGVTTALPGGSTVNPRTLYDLASLTKLFTTTAVLQLLEQGYFRLDDPAALFLPEFITEDKREITIRQLLTHSSGLKAHDDYYRRADSTQAMRREIARDPLQSPIGSVVCYSCLGYMALAGIVERVSGLALDEYLRRHVLTPLGMHATGYCPRQDRESIAPTEECPWRGRMAWGEVHDENAFAQGGVSGNAGLFGNLEEMAAFAQFWLNGGLHKPGILSPLTMQRSVEDATGHLGGERRGWGWLLKGAQYSFMGDLSPSSAFGHTGFTGTSLAIDPEQGSFVVWLTNRVHPTRNENRHIRYRALLHNAIWAALQ